MNKSYVVISMIKYGLIILKFAPFITFLVSHPVYLWGRFDQLRLRLCHIKNLKTSWAEKIDRQRHRPCLMPTGYKRIRSGDMGSFNTSSCFPHICLPFAPVVSFLFWKLNGLTFFVDTRKIKKIYFYTQRKRFQNVHFCFTLLCLFSRTWFP